MMNVIIETSRLLLREFTMEDAELVYELNRDPEVTRYTGDPIVDIEQAREVLEKSIIPQYAANNLGRWAVHTKPDLKFIGWCGLKFRPERNEIDLGYRFLRAARGKGFATEAAMACIDHGFKKLNLPLITGHSMPGNPASVKVLQNCGMQYVGEEIIDDHPALTYEISNPFIR
jgi:RimJ/RimL family protein N-acetyltransferase